MIVTDNMKKAMFLTQIAMNRYNMTTHKVLETPKQFMDRFLSNCQREADECMERAAEKAFRDDSAGEF